MHVDVVRQCAMCWISIIIDQVALEFERKVPQHMQSKLCLITMAIEEHE